MMKLNSKGCLLMLIIGLLWNPLFHEAIHVVIATGLGQEIYSIGILNMIHSGDHILHKLWDIVTFSTPFIILLLSIIMFYINEMKELKLTKSHQNYIKEQLQSNGW